MPDPKPPLHPSPDDDLIDDGSGYVRVLADGTTEDLLKRLAKHGYFPEEPLPPRASLTADPSNQSTL